MKQHIPLQKTTPDAMMETQVPSPSRHTVLEAVEAELVELERRLIASLVTVQRALGKEPSVITRAEKRAR